MVRDASQGEQGEKALRTYLKPFVESVADKFLGNERVKELDISREKLIEAGWTHLSLALNKYSEKLKERNSETYLFSTYFTWYIRQGMVEHVNSLNV